MFFSMSHRESFPLLQNYAPFVLQLSVGQYGRSQGLTDSDNDQIKGIALIK